MKVTKRYCDICGDEIPEHIHQEISISGFISMDSGCCNNVEIDACRQCGVEFFEKYYSMVEYNKNKKCANLHQPTAEVCN